MQQTLNALQLQLRSYQSTLVSAIYAEIKSGNNKVIAQLPTGGGKSKVISKMIYDACFKSKRVLVLAHREELLSQLHFHLISAGIPENWIGWIKAGKPEYLELPVQIASPQTWARRWKNWKTIWESPQLELALPEPDAAVLDNKQALPFGGVVLGGLAGRVRNWKRDDGIPKFDVILIDEAHHSAAKSYEIFWELYPEAKIIGLTATPSRGDGKGFDHLYQSLVCGPSTRELIDAKFLSEYRLVRGKILPNLKGLKIKAGEYAASDEAVDVFSSVELLGDVVSTWKQFIEPLSNKRTVGFAIRCDHARELCNQFLANGVQADYIDGEFTPTERIETLKKFITGETHILWQVGLFGEGFDLASFAEKIGLPPADICAVQIVRPVRSLALARQIYGRALRPVEGKIAYVIDHGRVHERCGFPCDDVEWKLEGSALRESPKKECSNLDCRQIIIILRSLNECPHCGHKFPHLKTPKNQELTPLEVTHDNEVEMEVVDPQSLDRFYEIKARYSIKGFAVNYQALKEFVKHHKPSFEQFLEAARQTQARNTLTNEKTDYFCDPWSVWFLWADFLTDKGVAPELAQLKEWQRLLWKFIKDYNQQPNIEKFRISQQKNARCKFPSTDWAQQQYDKFQSALNQRKLKIEGIADI